MDANTSATDCYEQILERILAVHYLPGTKLSITSLAQELNIEPTPIREGLARLVETGLVEMTDNRGFLVSPVSEHEIRDLYHTYLLIESMALKLAIERGDEAWKKQISETLEQLSQVEVSSDLTSENYWLWSQRHSAFHFSMISACSSPHLIRLRNELFRRFERFLRLALGKKGAFFKLPCRDHCNLADAVIKRDKPKASRLFKAHVMSSLEMVIQGIKAHHLL